MYHVVRAYNYFQLFFPTKVTDTQSRPAAIVSTCSAVDCSALGLIRASTLRNFLKREDRLPLGAHSRMKHSGCSTTPMKSMMLGWSRRWSIETSVRTWVWGCEVCVRMWGVCEVWWVYEVWRVCVWGCECEVWRAHFRRRKNRWKVDFGQSLKTQNI